MKKSVELKQTVDALRKVVNDLQAQEQMDAAAVIRCIGGLENIEQVRLVIVIVIRRIGGLERFSSTYINLQKVIRRIGGLENQHDGR